MRKILFVICCGLVVLVTNATDTNHKVASGETLYAIAKKYSVSVNEIIAANPELGKSANLRIGQQLVIPDKAKVVNTKTANARLHTVSKGESIYSICKKYGITATQLKQWNSLTNNSLNPGQKLVVAKVDKKAIYAYKPANVPSTPDTPYQQEDNRVRKAPDVKLEASTNTEKVPVEGTSFFPEVEKPAPVTLKTSSGNAEEYPDIFGGYAAGNFKMNKNKGAANYLNDNTSGNQYLAFYDGAETGSIIKVTNLMNKRTIYVKVMGKVPPFDASQEVMLKLTNTAANELGAVDEKFLVEVTSYTEK